MTRTLRRLRHTTRRKKLPKRDTEIVQKFNTKSPNKINTPTDTARPVTFYFCVFYGDVFEK